MKKTLLFGLFVIFLCTQVSAHHFSPGPHCVTTTISPGDNYQCTFSVDPSTSPPTFKPCTIFPLKLFCAISPDTKIPKNWQEAQGASYPGFDHAHTTIHPSFGGRTNVILINATDRFDYGIVSDYYVIDPNKIVTASVDVNCSFGRGEFFLEFWDNQYHRISAPFIAKTTAANKNKWERLFISQTSPATTRFATVLLKSDPTFITPTVTCGFDDVQLELSDNVQVSAPSFIPYEGYNDDLIVNPNIPYVSPVKGGYACCAPSQCWDGASCIDNMATNPLAPPQNDHRCIDGQWIHTPQKIDLEGNEGFCPVSTQCLVNIEGNSEFNSNITKYYLSQDKTAWPQCVDNTQFIEGNLCNNGIWSTRTREIALEMLKIAENRGNANKFTLYCDDFSHALVELTPTELDAIIGTKGDALARKCFDNRDIPCANNFCVMKFQDGAVNKSIVGMSLNILPNERPSMLAALQQSTTCPTTGNTFLPCNANTVYNPKLNALIFSKDGVTLSPSFVTSLFNSFKNLIRNVLSFFTLPDDENIIKVVENTNRFDRLYIRVADNKNIFSIQETITNDDYMLAEYRGFTENICTQLSRVSASPLGDGNLDCQASPGVTTIFSQDPGVIDRWQDFTSKLRIS